MSFHSVRCALTLAARVARLSPRIAYPAPLPLGSPSVLAGSACTILSASAICASVSGRKNWNVCRFSSGNSATFPRPPLRIASAARMRSALSASGSFAIACSVLSAPGDILSASSTTLLRPFGRPPGLPELAKAASWSAGARPSCSLWLFVLFGLKRLFVLRRLFVVGRLFILGRLLVFRRDFNRSAADLGTTGLDAWRANLYPRAGNQG